MKKTLLIASVVALAIGAQAQVDEWVNPFEKWGKYDYVQNESDQEFGKWYLEGGKYPTLVEYEDSTRIKFEGCKYFSIVFDLNDFNFPENCKCNLNIKFHFISKDVCNFDVYIRNYKENENPFGETFNFDSYNNSHKESYGKDVIFNESFLVKGYMSYNKDFRYVRISIFCEDYTDFYISHITITGTNGYKNKEESQNYREYNKFKYFYEPFFFKDLEGYQKPEITTSINTMESNTYVSNNVLYTNEPSSVYIFNASGILVKTENNTTSVDLSDLKKGVYIAKVNGTPIRFVR